MGGTLHMMCGQYCAHVCPDLGIGQAIGNVRRDKPQTPAAIKMITATISVKNEMPNPNWTKMRNGLSL